MRESEKFAFRIYHDGVVIEISVRGKQRFLSERAFLDELTGRDPSASQRPLPDHGGEFYYFDDDSQAVAYFAFRKKLDTQA